jgi:hypothetical protein
VNIRQTARIQLEAYRDGQGQFQTFFGLNFQNLAFLGIGHEGGLIDLISQIVGLYGLHQRENEMQPRIKRVRKRTRNLTHSNARHSSWNHRDA